MNAAGESIARLLHPQPWLVALLLPLLAIWLVVWLYDAHWAKETPQGHVFRTKTRHARFLPVEASHRFAYPGLYLGVDLAALERGGLDRGRLFRWQHPYRWSLLSIRSTGYLHAHRDGEKAGIRHRLLAELGKHGVDTTRIGRVYTVSMPAYGSFEGINPLVVHFAYSLDSRLAVVVLEVHNTFEERHIYVLQCGQKEDEKVSHGFEHQWTFPRSFHVSPFNDRSGYYRVSVSDPLAHSKKALPEKARINIKILLLTGDEVPQKKLMATLEGEGVLMTAPVLLSAIAALPFSLLLTTPRILYEAARLHYRKGLDVYPRPEPYVGHKEGDLNPVSNEALVGSVFWQAATSADHYARGVVERDLALRCRERGIRVALKPEDTNLAAQTFGDEGDPKLDISYASPLLFSDLLMAPSPALAIALADGRWQVSSPELFAKLYQAESDKPLSRWARLARRIRCNHLRWLHSFAPSTDLPDIPTRHAFDAVANYSLVSHLFWRAFNERLGCYLFRVLRARFVEGTEPWTVLARRDGEAVARVSALSNGIGSVRRRT